MMRKLWSIKSVTAAFFLLLVSVAVRAEEVPSYAYLETIEFVAFVEAAADALHREGEKVFADFRQEGGPWFRGDRYLFVWDLEGNRYVYPPDPAHERVNLLDLEDAGGKPIGKMIVAAAKDDGRGWVHYQWSRPHEIEPQWKSTYIVKTSAPSGSLYLVGSGMYQAKVEKAFIVEEVKKAAALLQQQGRKAFATLRDPKSRFFFHDTYIFVISAEGVELVNPAFPALEGRNLRDVRDINGKYIVREFTELAQNKGGGWVSYYWPKPESPQIPVKKTTYITKVAVNGEFLIVGAGMYE